MPKFPDTPKRTKIGRAGLLDIYTRQFGLPVGKMLNDDLEAAIRKFGRCECGDKSCKKPLQGKVEFDHGVAIALQYKGDPTAWFALLPACHKIKTGNDIKLISKAKRVYFKKQQYDKREAAGGSRIKGRSSFPTGRKIQSRVFNKRLRKKMDGTVEVRDA